MINAILVPDFFSDYLLEELRLRWWILEGGVRILLVLQFYKPAVMWVMPLMPLVAAL